jgi:ribulose 1,5-bisphosphate synthetase/thiazole synthase
MNGDVRRFDVAVIGGGSAGLAAAVTAARNGARTILIERYGFLGGMGTASLVHSFCGLYLLREEPGAVIANPGICSEIEERMIAATGIGPRRMGRVDVLPQHPVEFARIADEMANGESLLETAFHTEVTGVSNRSDVWQITVSGRSGPRRIDATNLVDASGDAVVAGLIGAESVIEVASHLQRPAYIFGVRCESGAENEFPLRTSGLLVEGMRAGEVSSDALGLSFRATGRPGELFGTLDLTGGSDPGDYDPLDPACLGRLESLGRKVATAAVRWLARRDEAWRGAFISHWPLRAGVRESRRWLGESVLTGADLLDGARFEDEIALATWPMEFRETAKGPRLHFPRENRPAGIPLGCLKPKGIERLFVAGRCISADHDAQASIRVMGTCFATGEAAGKAAAAACV